MNTAFFRFYADLNYFLPKDKKQRTFPYPIYDGDQSVKHLIEAQGIPHTEVDLILADGQAVDFNHIVQRDEHISIYPAFSSLAIETETKLRPPLPDPIRFLLDNHLGRLARYLRLLGFDALYFNNELDDEQLSNLSHESQRVLLSRDRGLLKRSQVIYGYCLRTTDSYDQLKSVIRRFQLVDKIEPWKRCLRCNGILQPVEKDVVMESLQPKTKLYFEEFQQCAACNQVYWRGSHTENLQAFLDRFLSEFT
ncbi:MAG: Mut7-C RNAse domain-containing protein [Candidatus Promineifilaceae bacterium]